MFTYAVYNDSDMVIYHILERNDPYYIKSKMYIIIPSLELMTISRGLPTMLVNSHRWTCMVSHAMTMGKLAVHRLHPQQVPVIAVARHVQWSWPETHAKPKFKCHSILFHQFFKTCYGNRSRF